MSISQYLDGEYMEPLEWSDVEIAPLIALYQFQHPEVTAEKLMQDFGFPNKIMVTRKLKAKGAHASVDWKDILDHYALEIDFESAIETLKRMQQATVPAQIEIARKQLIDSLLAYDDSYSKVFQRAPHDNSLLLSLTDQKMQKNWSLFPKKRFSLVDIKQSLLRVGLASKTQLGVPKVDSSELFRSEPFWRLYFEALGKNFHDSISAHKITVATTKEPAYIRLVTSYQQLLSGIRRELPNNPLLSPPFERSFLLIDPETNSVKDETILE